MAITVERLEGTVTFRTRGAAAQLKKLDQNITVATRNREVEIGIDVDAQGARTKVTAATKVAGAGQKVEVKVDVDQSAAGFVKRSLSKIAEGLFRVNQESKKSSNGLGAFTRKVFTLNQAMTALSGAFKAMKLASMVIAVPFASAALQALSSSILAVASSLSTLIGLLAVVPGMIFALGSAASALVTAFRGIGGAFAAYSASQKKAFGGGGGSGMADQAKGLADAVERTKRAVESANRAIENSNRSLADSERGLEDALDREIAAQERLIDARDLAENQLEDLVNATVGYALQEERAINSVEDARKELDFLNSDPAATDRELEEAALDLMEAELRLVKVKQGRGRAEEDLIEGMQKGIDQSDVVVSAQDEIESSALNLERAQFNLERAFIGVADAQYNAAKAAEALAEAQKKQTAGPVGGGGGGIDAFAAAMAELTPAGRAFVTQAIRIKDAFKGIQDSVAEAALPGFTSILVSLEKLMPSIGNSLTNIGATIGLAAGGFAEFLASASGMADFNTVLGSSEVIAGDMATAGFNLVEFFISLAAAVAPLTEWVSGLVLSFSEYINKTLEVNRENGDLERGIGRIMEVATTVGHIIRDTTAAIVNFFSAGSGTGDDLLGTLEGLSAEFRSWTETEDGRSSMKQWFEDMKPLASELWGLIGDLTGGLAGIGQGGTIESLTGVVKGLREIIPDIKDFFATMGASGTGQAIVDFLLAIAGVFGAVVQSGGGLKGFLTIATTLLTLLTGFLSLPGVADVFSAILIAFISLKSVAFALTPIIAVLGQFHGMLKAGSIFFKLSMKAMLGWVGVGLLVVVAIAALAYGLYYAYKHSEKFRKIVDKVVKVLKTGLLVVVNKLVKVWDRLVSAFKEGGIGGVFSELKDIAGEALQAIGDGIIGIVDRLPEWLSAMGTWMTGTMIPKLLEWGIAAGKTFLKFAWWVLTNVVPELVKIYLKIQKWIWTKFIPALLKAGFEIGKAFLGWIWDGVQKLPGLLWEVLKAFASWVTGTAVPWIIEKVADFVPAFLEFIGDIAEKIPGAMITVLTKIGEWVFAAKVGIKTHGLKLAGYVLDGIKTLATKAYNWIKDELPGKLAAAVSMAWNAIKSVGKSIGNAIKSGILSILDAMGLGKFGDYVGLGADGGISGSTGNTGSRGTGRGGATLVKGALGTYIPNPQIMLVGEAGPEVLIPLTRPDRALELFNESGLGDVLARANVPHANIPGPQSGSTIVRENGKGISIGEININGTHMSPDEAMRAAWSEARATGAS